MGDHMGEYYKGYQGGYKECRLWLQYNGNDAFTFHSRISQRSMGKSNPAVLAAALVAGLSQMLEKVHRNRTLQVLDCTGLGTGVAFTCWALGG